MKKLFTIVAFCAAALGSYTASAGMSATEHVSTLRSFKGVNSLGSYLRSADTCSGLINVNLNTDTETYYLSQVGYLSGNGQVETQGGSYYNIAGVAEEYTLPTAGTNYNATGSLVFFGYATVNPSDSGVKVWAYVYDTTGTGGSPGVALDSAYVTLGAITDTITSSNVVQQYLPNIFNFTHQATIYGSSFFIAVVFPQILGDTVVVTTNTFGHDGNAWLNLASGGPGWYPVATAFGAPLGNYIYTYVCGTPDTTASSCPTITVHTTQIGNDSASATATGGVAPYTYSWSNAQNTDTATGLTAGTKYSVTATDHNGCTGVDSVTITGIQQIAAGVADFSVYPNPSNGVINAALHLTTASDVTMTIVDMTGSQVYQSNDLSVKDQVKAINLGTIAPGIYIVNVKTASGSVNQRIAIQ